MSLASFSRFEEEDEPKMSRKSTKNPSKIHPKSTKNLPKLDSWELLGRLVELLEASWAHLDAKSQKVSKKAARWTSPTPSSCTQNPPKIH